MSRINNDTIWRALQKLLNICKTSPYRVVFKALQDMSTSKNIQEQLKANIINPLDRTITIFRGLELYELYKLNEQISASYWDWKALNDFGMFIYNIITLLEHSESKIRDQILERLTKIRDQNNPTTKDLRGFYYEVRSLINLKRLGFTIESIPSEQKVELNKSPADGIVTKDNKQFQVECKTLHHEKGHPIHEMACQRFLELLQGSPEYNELLLSSNPRTILYKIDKKLYTKSSSTEIYSPEDLVEKFQHDWMNQTKNIKLTQGINQQLAWETLRTGRSFVINRGCTLFILDSEMQNSYFQQLEDLAINSIEKKIKKGIVRYPIILCLESPYPLVVGKEYILSQFKNITTDEHRLIELLEYAQSHPESAPKNLYIDYNLLARELDVLKSKSNLVMLSPTMEKLQHTLNTRITEPVMILWSYREPDAVLPMMNEQMRSLLLNII